MLATLHAVSSLFFTSNLIAKFGQRRSLPAFGVENQKLDKLTIAIPNIYADQPLQELVTQILQQSLRPHEILLIEPPANTATHTFLQELAKIHPELRLVRVEAAPSLWREKVWALHQLLRETKTKHILFIDPELRLDSRHAVGALWSAYLRSQSSKSELGVFLSVFPTARLQNPTARVAEQLYSHFYDLVPLLFRKWSESEGLVASSQVMLADAELLKSLGGFGRLRGSMNEGLKVARVLKSQGQQVFAFNGGPHFSCSRYIHLSALFKEISDYGFKSKGAIFSVAAVGFMFFWIFVLPVILLPYFLMNPFWILSFLYLLYGQYKVSHNLELGFIEFPKLRST